MASLSPIHAHVGGQRAAPHLQQAAVLLHGHEEGVRPLVVQELQRRALARRERRRLLALAPGRDDERAACARLTASV